jgi:hypothetical protein
MAAAEPYLTKWGDDVKIHLWVFNELHPSWPVDEAPFISLPSEVASRFTSEKNPAPKKRRDE